MSGKKFLTDVYGLNSVDDTRRLYDDWSASYDQEISENGYATPKRVASALSDFLTDQSAPILDFGCGTGMSGVALRSAGFDTLDGCDLSEQMLEQARAKDVYQTLWQATPDSAFSFDPGRYAAITAVGVISKGAAPPETLDSLLDALSPGGLLAFSFNDHTFEDPRFVAKVSDHLARKTCQQVFCQDGEHLPGINLRSTVYILERL